MTQEISFLLSGAFFGLVAGVSPGPLLALVLSETLKYGKKEGIKIAAAPLITDLPIVLFVLFILSSLANYRFIIGAIAFVGAAYLVYLGFENLRAKLEIPEIENVRRNSLRRGVTANFFSPSPYLFWLSVGGPIIFESLNVSMSAAILFVVGFYALLVGSKTIIALLVDKSKVSIKNRYFIYAVRVLGIILILYALILVKDGLELLNII